MHVDLANMRPVLQRFTSLRGPKFYRSGDDRAVILFVNQLDASTRDGPREAMESDAVGHPDAYQAFLKEDAAEQAGRPHMPGVELEAEPLRPLVKWEDPPEGKPPAERGAHARRRDEAAARGETA